MRKLKYLLPIISAVLIMTPANPVLAGAGLMISEKDITFSKDNPLADETIRVFAHVFNKGAEDIKGFLVFLSNDEQISSPQAISLRSDTYDDVFIDWKFQEGNNKIEVRLVDTLLGQIELENGSKSVWRDYFVDLDTDNDGIGNTKDEDDDNDGLSDSDEEKIGTSPLSSDTDNDKVNDRIDIFPLDNNEYRDTDKDGYGDNADSDDDNDGLTDEEEIYVYGTNPLSPDSDADGFDDGKEIAIGTNPNNQDTDSDKIIDSKDKSPLNAAIATASLMNSVNVLLQDRPYIYVILGALTVIVCFFIFRRKK